MNATTATFRARPPLLPSAHWARAALLLLILFALLRSVLWASVQPAWLAPDEDYHWLYINYIVEKHTVPNLSKPFTTDEFVKGVQLTNQGIFLAGPQTVYSGNPHAVLSKLGGPLSEREPVPPDPRPVLHPPGYYLGGALVDEILWHKVSVTRLTGIRYYSALLGAVTIFFAWLLAAQVLAREWQRLAAAALVSLQPILAFSASIVTNDVGVAAILTATLAYCAWMLRGPPVARQGIWLGALFAIALMVKATMLSLLITIAATLALSWRTYPESRRQLLSALKWIVVIPLVVAGWWYVRQEIVTGSILGERGSLIAANGVHGPGILHVPSVVWLWLSIVYRSYWFSYLFTEVKADNIWFWLPTAGIAIVAGGYVLLLLRSRGTLFDRTAPELRVVTLITLTALVLVLVAAGLDTLRGVRGLTFTTAQGRFIAPVYPGLAVIAILALRELTAWSRRAFPIVVATSVAAAFVFYWHTWIVWVLERFYGAINGDWGRELDHASFYKPEFITAGSLAAMLIGALLAFAAAFVVTIWGEWRERSRPEARSSRLRETSRVPA